MTKTLTRGIAVLLLLAALLTLGGCASLSQTLLTVDGYTVTRGMFNYFVSIATDEYMQNNLAEGQPLDPRATVNGRSVGDLIVDMACSQLASEYGMLRIGRDNGITFDDAIYDTVREKVEETEKEYGAAVLEAYYAEMGMSREDYIQLSAVFEMEDQIRAQLFAAGGKYYPDETELAEIRRTLEEDLCHVIYAQVSLKDSMNEDNLPAAEAIRAKMLEEGADWEKIVDTYADNGDANADNDAYIDMTGDADPNVVAAIRSLQVGEVSEVVATENYYYVIGILEKEDSYVESAALLRATSKAQELLDEVIDQLEVEETSAFNHYKFESK